MRGENLTIKYRESLLLIPVRLLRHLQGSQSSVIVRLLQLEVHQSSAILRIEEVSEVRRGQEQSLT